MKVENNTMNRLKKLRNEKKLTLRELAEVLNIHRDSLMRMENGMQGISDEYLKIFSEFYGVSTDYILGLSEIRNPKELNDELYIDIVNEIKELHEFGIAVFSSVAGGKQCVNRYQKIMNIMRQWNLRTKNIEICFYRFLMKSKLD
jgi:transcriptional regulator with XRE-family HTH domain